MKTYSLIILAALLLFSASLVAQNLEIKVYGNCEMCMDRIEEAALSSPGVTAASWSSKTKLLNITVDSAAFQEALLHKNIAAVGHDTDKEKADNAVYQALPQCCLYRDHDHDGNYFIYGMISENNASKKSSEPLIGATVYWMEDNEGTTTGMDGDFRLMKKDNNKKLIISYIGYGNDTVTIEKSGHLEIQLEAGVILDEVTVSRRRSSTTVSYVQTIKTKQISSKELTKAACCNLSESFETNPSVDVSFTDAVTGTRTIEMLGLAGPNIQVTREVMPDIRGLAAITGFMLIPGPWVSGMQLNLGTGSVLNGYESISGQINIELKKPWDTERLHVNGYVNNSGRYEGNVVANTSVSPKWQTNVLGHYSYNSSGNDRNDDGFMDMPAGQIMSLGNIWKYEKGDGNEGMIGMKLTKVDQESGQNHKTFDHNSGPIWLAQNDINRSELWLKRGKVFKDQPYKSIGMQLSGVIHDQKSTFGNTVYTGVQKSIYANFLYQTIFGDTDHKIVFGSSFLMDHYDENVFGRDYKRREYVPGVFGEYTQHISEKIDMIAGLRLDHHNNFGLFVTPRLHLRYALSPTDVFRFSGGSGQRTANIFAENLGVMASSRQWVIKGSENSSSPYGLQPEKAWNFGASYSKNIEFGDNTLDLGLDYYYTDFTNQIVADFDQSPQVFALYNLDGKSYSHSVQTQADLVFGFGLDVRLAYRYVDVKTTYNGALMEKPLVSPNRAFVNLAYHVDGWSLDYTLNWQDSKRLPDTRSNPQTYQLGERSPAFFISNAQVTKSWNKKFELYVGGENLLDFRQDKPILGSNDPFGNYFDSSMVWGPVFGRMVYAGFRYMINTEKE